MTQDCFGGAPSVEETKKTIDLRTADLGKRLKDRRISLEITDTGRDLIAQESYDPVGFLR